MSLSDGKVLVTGATRGIGAAVLKAFAAAGCEVCGTASRDEGAAHIDEALKAAGGKGFGLRYAADEEGGAEALAAALKERDFAPDVLVNNAGITRDNLLMRMDDDEWEQVLEVNLNAVFRLSKACLRGMVKARRGRIVNISSVIALSGNAGQCNYAASKAGLIGFTKSLAHEVAARNITVNCVAPGFIETSMTEGLSEEVRAAALARIPVGRFGACEEVASVVLFLASDAAAYITGETINISGGMYMR